MKYLLLVLVLLASAGCQFSTIPDPNTVEMPGARVWLTPTSTSCWMHVQFGPDWHIDVELNTRQHCYLR